MLKMDVEFSEWAALEAMLTYPASLRNVKQFAFEFHTKELKSQGWGVTTAEDFTYYWLLLRGLDSLGFKIWHYVHNTCCGKVLCCGMMYFVNIAYIV